MRNKQVATEGGALDPHKCWFCQTNPASYFSPRIITLHKYEGVSRKVVRHIKQDIHIPQCKECAEVWHKSGKLINKLIIPLIIISMAGGVFGGIFVSKITDGMVLAAIGAGLVAWILLIAVMLILLNFIQNRSLTEDEKSRVSATSKDVKQFPPLKQLLMQGWSLTA